VETTGRDEAPISIVFGDDTQQDEPYVAALPEEGDEDKMEGEEANTF
jgi:hypothetical protein